jgi:hypothetical protein
VRLPSARGRAETETVDGGKPDCACNGGYSGVVATAKNTCEFVVGRLLEIRVAGFRSSADIRAQTAGIARAVASLPKDAKYVIAGDWRAAQIMAPEMAVGAAEMLARVNSSIARSGILTLPERSTANLQIFRLVRESQNPSRRHFTSASGMHPWLSEELTPEESSRLPHISRYALSVAGAARSAGHRNP